MTTYRFAFVIGAISVLMFLANRALADFSGPYTFAPDDGLYTPSKLPSGNFTVSVGTWTLSGTISPNWENGYMIAQANEFRFDTGPAKMDGNFFEEISLTHTIAASGILSFDYSVSLGSPYSPSSGDVAGYKINGQLTVLPAGTGTVSFAVNQGDLFGFYLYAGPECVTCQPAWGSQSMLDVTNFSAPVPEPTTIALFLSSGLGVALFRARRRLRRSGSGRAREVVDLDDQQLRRF